MLFLGLFLALIMVGTPAVALARLVWVCCGEA